MRRSSRLLPWFANRTRRRGPAAWLTSALGVAVVGGLLLPGAASALTRGFDIHNYSSVPLRIDKIETLHSGDLEGGGPPVGAVLQPGRTQHFELIEWFGPPSRATVFYQSVGADGSATIWMGGCGYLSNVCGPDNEGIVDHQTYCRSVSGPLGCFTKEGVEGLVSSDATIFDKRPTTVTLTPQQKQEQADRLEALCNEEGSPATCSFKATSQDDTAYAPPVPYIKEVTNDTPVSQTFSKAASKAVTDSTSVGVSVKAGFKMSDAISAEVSATYSHTWTTSVTIQETVNLTAPAGNVCQVFLKAPVIQYKGDFTAKLKNTTWHIDDVTVNEPDGSREGEFIYSCQCSALGVARNFCKAETPPTSGVVDTSRKVTARRGQPAASTVTLPPATRVVDQHLQLKIEGPRIDRAGVPAVYRVGAEASAPDGQLMHQAGPATLEVSADGKRLDTWSMNLAVARIHRFTVTPEAVGSGSLCLTAKATARDAVSDLTRDCVHVIR